MLGVGCWALDVGSVVAGIDTASRRLHLFVIMYAPEPKKPLTVRVQERLAASRFLTFSVLLHAVLVLMGGSVVLFKQYVEPPDFAASDGGLVSSDVQVQAPPEQPPDLTQQKFTPETP